MLNGFVEQIKVTRLSLLLGRHMSMFFSHSCEFCEIFMSTLVVYRPPVNNPWACFFIIFVSDRKYDNSMGVRKHTN